MSHLTHTRLVEVSPFDLMTGNDYPKVIQAANRLGLEGKRFVEVTSVDNGHGYEVMLISEAVPRSIRFRFTGLSVFVIAFYATFSSIGLYYTLRLILERL